MERNESHRFWISDFISHHSEIITKMFEDKYGQYLEALGGADYRQKVLDYVSYEDTPRSLNFQLALLAKVGFTKIDILHKNSSFAAFGAIKNNVFQCDFNAFDLRFEDSLDKHGRGGTGKLLIILEEIRHAL